jgi:predicted  nucleic acid-binding Zn-ribbon protein
MVKVKCPRCGYVWDYQGKLAVATCPNCLRKFRVGDHLVREE